MIKKIIFRRKLIAIIIPHEFQRDGVEFFTPEELSQQLAYMRHQAGYKINPHIHKTVIRKIQYTQEVLIVKKGRVAIELFSNDKKYVGREELVTGDVILLAGGGHSVEFIEGSELIEVKQGPFISTEEDKEIFKKDER